MLLKNSFIILIFIFGFFSLKSEEIISIQDTSFVRGEIINLPITNLVEFQIQDSLVFTFEYNQFVIDIKNATLSTNIVNDGVNINFENDVYSSPAVFKVTLRGLSTLPIGEIFLMRMEGLAGSDSLANLKLINIISGETITDYSANHPNIKVIGTPVFQTYPEALFNNAPNPFRGSTVFKFNINNTSKADFELYDYFGCRIYDKEGILEHIKIYKLLPNNVKMEIENKSGDFEQGKYELTFTADEYYLASGGLILTMKTNSGFHSKTFLMVK